MIKKQNEGESPVKTIVGGIIILSFIIMILYWLFITFLFLSASLGIPIILDSYLSREPIHSPNFIYKTFWY